MKRRAAAGAGREAALALQRAAGCAQRGEWLSAEGICLYLLEEAPGHLEAMHLLAEVRAAQGRREEALEVYRGLLELQPRDARALYNRGTLLAVLQRHDEALRDLDAALLLAPRDPAALVNRGNVLLALGRSDAALASLDAALALEPGNAQAHYNRGNALRALGRSADALVAYRRALALDARHADALGNCASVLGDLQRHDEALACYERALALDEGRADLHYNRGNALRSLQRDSDACASYERAIALDPEHVNAHWNLSWALLALGDFGRGFAEHEWRRRSPEHLAQRYPSSAEGARPQWRAGAEPPGGTVLVHAEQGIGDTLQFMRYLPMIADGGAQVVLQVQPALARLCAQFDPRIRVIAEGAELPPHEFLCPVASLPWAFGTRLETIPRSAPYLRADPALAGHWRERMDPARPGRRIGLVWAGNPRQGSEPRRGVGLAACRPLFEVPGIRWFGLQVGPRAADAALLSPGTLTDLASGFADFADTAAAIENLDLVITTDTAVAHLAGAMDKAVWMLLMFAPDWRWLRGRDDSPWYPSARLFRQSAPGDWAGVVARVGAALQVEAAARGRED